MKQLDPREVIRCLIEWHHAGPQMKITNEDQLKHLTKRTEQLLAYGTDDLEALLDDLESYQPFSQRGPNDFANGAVAGTLHLAEYDQAFALGRIAGLRGEAEPKDVDYRFAWKAGHQDGARQREYLNQTKPNK